MELKAYIAPTPDGTGLADYYLKSEADSVFVELEAENESLLQQNRELCQALQVMYSKEEYDKQKHKRCLAMAEWCECKRIDAANYRIPREKWEFYDKWQKRWHELAEKFKEAK